jgi:hypothetical protein
LGVHPRVVGVADGQALEFDPRFLGARQVVGDFAGLRHLIVFEQGVEQRGAVFDVIAGVRIARRQGLAIQRRGLFRLALVEVGGSDPAQGVGRQLHAFALEHFVIADHLCGARPGFQRAQTVDAPAHHVVMGAGLRRPGGEQLVVILEGAVSNHVALFFTAGRELGHAHAFGRQVAFEAALGDRVQQARAFGSQAQGRLRQACALQGDDVFAGDFGCVAGTDEGLVEFEQCVVGKTCAGQCVAQCHAAVGVVGLGGHQGAGALHGFGGLAGIRLGQGQAQLQVRVIRFALQRLAVHGKRRFPTLLVAIGAGNGGQRLGGEGASAALGLVDRQHLGVLARPAGDQQMIADLSGRLALGGQLAQQVEGRTVVAAAGLVDQRIIGRIGRGHDGPQQLAAQGQADKGMNITRHVVSFLTWESRSDKFTCTTHQAAGI